MKACPFMSRPMWDQESGSFMHIVDCQEEECMAWQPGRKESILRNYDEPGAMHDPLIERKHPGFCKLIDGKK